MSPESPSHGPRRGWIAAALGVALALSACVSQPRYRGEPPSGEPAEAPGAPPREGPAIPTEGAYQVGVASYYAHEFHGRPTASGEVFDMYGLSAAHRELPLGTVIRVTHLTNGRAIQVKVNDRGPFVDGRVLDLSLGAARRLDMVEEGIARVKIEILRTPD